MNVITNLAFKIEDKVKKKSSEITFPGLTINVR